MSRLRKTVWLKVVSLLAGLLISALVPDQEHYAPRSTSRYIQSLEDLGQDPWQQPERVIAAFGLKQRDHVADLSAGPGYYTLRIARTVGPVGKISGVDISREMLDYRLVNIDFHKWSLPVGPLVQMKIPKAEMICEAEPAGFRPARQYNLLPVQYFVVFAR